MRLIPLLAEDGFDWSKIPCAGEIQDGLIAQLEMRTARITKGCYPLIPVYIGEKRDPWCVEIEESKGQRVSQKNLDSAIASLTGLGFGRSWLGRLSSYVLSGDALLTIIKVRFITKGECS